MTAEELAILFHATYERLAPSFGYETREETRTFNPDSANGKLMIAVCDAVLGPIYADMAKEIARLKAQRSVSRAELDAIKLTMSDAHAGVADSLAELEALRGALCGHRHNAADGCRMEAP